MSRRGQAMVETVLAVLIVSSVFVCLFKLSRMLTGKIVLEHAAMRVARARAVGYNRFMCVKAARICTIPVAGERLTPGESDERTGISESALARVYLRTPDWSHAEGLLSYRGWDRLSVVPGDGGASHVALKDDWFDLTGEAEVDSFPDYLQNEGR